MELVITNNLFPAIWSPLVTPRKRHPSQPITWMCTWGPWDITMVSRPIRSIRTPNNHALLPVMSSGGFTSNQEHDLRYHTFRVELIPLILGHVQLVLMTYPTLPNYTQKKIAVWLLGFWKKNFGFDMRYMRVGQTTLTLMNIIPKWREISSCWARGSALSVHGVIFATAGCLTAEWYQIDRLDQIAFRLDD